MSIAYESRKIQRGDEEGLVGLYNQVFSGRTSIDYWRWKYFENPAGEVLGYIALSEGKIIANVAAIPIRFKVGAEEVIATQGCDVAVAARFRKGTPFLRLSNLEIEENKRRNIQFIYGFSKKNACTVTTRLLGFSNVGKMYKLVKVINPAPFLRRDAMVDSFAGLLGTLGRWGIKLFTKPALRTINGVLLKKITRFDHTSMNYGRLVLTTLK